MLRPLTTARHLADNLLPWLFMKGKPELPYWLSSGPETCTDCTHSYHREVVFRCAGCDRGVCASCVTLLRESREALCAACLSADMAG